MMLTPMVIKIHSLAVQASCMSATMTKCGDGSPIHKEDVEGRKKEQACCSMRALKERNIS